MTTLQPNEREVLGYYAKQIAIIVRRDNIQFDPTNRQLVKELLQQAHKEEIGRVKRFEKSDKAYEAIATALYTEIQSQ